MVIFSNRKPCLAPTGISLWVLQTAYSSISLCLLYYTHYGYICQPYADIFSHSGFPANAKRGMPKHAPSGL